jgi:hypothetical protein
VQDGTAQSSSRIHQGVSVVPLHTEARIRQLIKKVMAVSANDEGGHASTLRELRVALREHVRLVTVLKSRARGNNIPKESDYWR